MKRNSRGLLLPAALGLLLLPRIGFAALTVTSAAGANPAAITTAVTNFRTALGPLNPNTTTSFPAGRREINWDGVPDALAAPNALPANFFNSNSPRGVVFSTPGTGFQVSANAGIAPVRFGNIDATYTARFQTFSAQRLFTAIGSNVTDVNFFLPGSAASAATTAFGAVFTDVETANSTSIQLFDLTGSSLGTFFAPVSGTNGLSFLGIDSAGTANIGRVRITSGNAALGDPQSGNDLVVMDDFIYSEPQAAALAQTPVPTLSGWAMLVMGIALASAAVILLAIRR
ncbi:MAG: hypothetical protein ABI914_03575 [Acidobacteriota bacterium]